MTMKARVKWIEDLTFLGESNSGNTIVMSSGKKSGGKDSCPTPMELLLLGLGGCSSIDVIAILEKARQNVTNCEVDLTGERFDGVPATFTKMNCHFIVTGHDLSDKQVKRAVDLSFEKYCSVAMMLKEKAEVTWSYEIKEA